MKLLKEFTHHKPLNLFNRINTVHLQCKVNNGDNGAIMFCTMTIITIANLTV